MNYYVVLLASIVITGLAQWYINHNYKKYKNSKNAIRMTGENVARNILDRNELIYINVAPVKGKLTDNYNPMTKTVNLSEEVFYGDSVAAMAVAAHECGHAIQDKNKYVFLRIRKALVPVVNAASTLAYISIFIGFLFTYMQMIEIGIVVEAITLLFEIITLPVEIDASKRGLKELEEFTMFDQSDLKGSKKMLISAALTYVAASITTLLNLLRLILITRDRNDN